MNIQFLKDRIIIDGHAETKEQCETITLLCNNLAKSKDFKTVRYESGYAEFEKVEKAKELKFAAARGYVTFIFDNTVVSVTNSYGTITTSGEKLMTADTQEDTLTFVVALQEGYEIDTAVLVNNDSEALGTIDHYTSNTIYGSAGYGGLHGTITIATKQSGSSTTKQTIDLSTLSGWANLSSGSHQITVKAKANGYADSAASNAVSVAKVASGYTVTLNNGDVPVPFSYYINENASVLVGASSLPLVLNNVYKIKLEINATGNYLTNTTGSLVGHENDIFGNYVNITEDSSANVYTDQ